MALVIVSKQGFFALVLWVLKGMNGCRVIIRIETGHSNLVSCFGPRIRALARYFTSAFASVKYLSQRPHPRAKTWHKIWMTGLNPTSTRTSVSTVLTKYSLYLISPIQKISVVNNIKKHNYILKTKKQNRCLFNIESWDKLQIICEYFDKKTDHAVTRLHCSSCSW